MGSKAGKMTWNLTYLDFKAKQHMRCPSREDLRNTTLKSAFIKDLRRPSVAPWWAEMIRRDLSFGQVLPLWLTVTSGKVFWVCRWCRQNRSNSNDREQPPMP